MVNEWKARKEIGDDKFEHWKDAKKIDNRPNSMTGSTDPKVVEWALPCEWVDAVDQGTVGINIQAEGKATEQDFENSKSMRDSQPGASASSGDKTDEQKKDVVKAPEPEKEESDVAAMMERRVAEFLKKLSVIFKELSNMIVVGKETRVHVQVLKPNCPQAMPLCLTRTSRTSGRPRQQLTE